MGRVDACAGRALKYFKYLRSELSLYLKKGHKQKLMLQSVNIFSFNDVCDIKSNVTPCMFFIINRNDLTCKIKIDLFSCRSQSRKLCQFSVNAWLIRQKIKIKKDKLSSFFFLLYRHKKISF